MQVLKHVLNFYINSSIHVALAVVSLTYITFMEFNIPKDTNLLFFIFFASVTGYNFVKFFGVAKFHHRSLTTWLKLIQIFSLISFVWMCYYALKLEMITLLYVVGFGMLTFLYAMPLFPVHRFLDEKNNLRNIGGLKVFLIALVWTGVTVVLPLINNHSGLISTAILLSSIQRFLWVVMLMIPFEIRDLQFDSVKLATVPQLLGVTGTKLLGLLLGIGYIILECLKDKTFGTNWIVLCIILVITLMLIVFSKEKQHKYYSALWVEGVPILWLVMLLLFT